MRADDVIDYAKRNIIILTTNETIFLGRDESGDTRAITLRSELKQNEFMLLAEFAKEYPKILAQAIRMYRSGATSYLLQNEFELQREQVEERDITITSDEYDLICDYFQNEEELAICKKQGIYLDRIYVHAMESWDMMKPELMKRSRLFGAALVKYGFSKHDNKARLINGKIRKVWFWKGE
jgi:predicted P-loop ATPase